MYRAPETDLRNGFVGSRCSSDLMSGSTSIPKRTGLAALDCDHASTSVAIAAALAALPL